MKGVLSEFRTQMANPIQDSMEIVTSSVDEKAYNANAEVVMQKIEQTDRFTYCRVESSISSLYSSK